MVKSTFSEEDKDLIRKLHDEDGLSYAAIAARYGVAPITINRICRPDLAARQAEQRKQYRINNSIRVQEYEKQAYRNYSIRFHRKNDADIIKQLDQQENIIGYIRALIAADVARREAEGTGAPGAMTASSEKPEDRWNTNSK